MPERAHRQAQHGRELVTLLLVAHDHAVDLLHDFRVEPRIDDLLAVLLGALAAAVAALGWSEGRSALAALAAVGVYYCVLWLFRHKIEHTIHFSITKNY